jgi:lipid-A-disaccharide synthase
MNSCLVIAGEKSGEEHALSFFRDLKKQLPHTTFFGIGGDELQAEGLELIYHLNDFSSWGYSEVVKKIPFYIKAMKNIEDEVVKRNCKVAILVDFQSFNLKLAGKLKKLNIDVLYFVAPQAWAWKEYRVKKLASSVHTLFTIIPFERDWFKERGVKQILSITHPLLTTYQDQLRNFKSHYLQKNKSINILLLPGSRNFEVQNLLRDFTQAIKLLRKELNIHVSIVQSSSVNKKLYDSYAEYFDTVYKNEDLVIALQNADFAFAASGTVTLACALFELPTIVCYRVSLINYFIYQTFVNYTGPASLANIIHNRSVFPELIQDQSTSFNIVTQIKKWYNSNEEYLKLKAILKTTKNVVEGEALDVALYMAQVINRAYEKEPLKNN